MPDLQSNKPDINRLRGEFRATFHQIALVQLNGNSEPFPVVMAPRPCWRDDDDDRVVPTPLHDHIMLVLTSDSDSSEERMPVIEERMDSSSSEEGSEGEVTLERALNCVPPLSPAPPLLRPPHMTESQYSRLTNVVSELESASSRDLLTQTQIQRLRVTLENVQEVRSTLVQMVEIHLEDEEVSSNLFALLDFIDQAQAVHELLEVPEGANQSIDSKREQPEEVTEAALHQAEDKFADLRNAVAFAELEGDVERVCVLQREYEMAMNREYDQQIYGPVHGLVHREYEPIHREYEPIRGVQSLVDDRLNIQVPLNGVDCPPGLLNAEEGSLKVNPSPLRVGEASLTVNGVFSDAQAPFYLIKNVAALSSVQYLEVTIKSIHKSFQPPFALSLWSQFHNMGLVQFSFRLLERLMPFSVALFESPGTLHHSIQGETVNEGDVLGMGVIPCGGDEFLMFGTRNGLWLGAMPLIKTSDAFYEILRPLLIAGSPYQKPQLEVEINDGSDESIPFKFDFSSLEVEDCSICYDDVLSGCVQVMESCNHRFCGKCVTNYLVAALDSGEVVGTQCPDNSCSELMTDNDLMKALTNVQFAKFKQFRTLAKLQLEPNCRWCPKEGCQAGVIADLECPLFPKLTCGDCDTEFCFECSDRWHPGMTCRRWANYKKKSESKQETKRKKKEELGTKKWMKDNKTVKCVRCSALVQRNEGCNHMTCTCGHEFCWLCGETILSVGLHYLTSACAGRQFSHKDELPTSRRIVRGAIAPIRFVVTLPIAGFQRLVG